MVSSAGVEEFIRWWLVVVVVMEIVVACSRGGGLVEAVETEVEDGGGELGNCVELVVWGAGVVLSG